MRVTIHLFARLRELAGIDELARQLSGATTVAELWAALTREFPVLEPYSGSVSAAVNDEYAPMSQTVADGDEVAFLPPVSGGGPDAGAAAAPDGSRPRNPCLTS